MIAPQISSLIDDWHSKGKIMLSGPFDSDVSSMAVFELWFLSSLRLIYFKLAH